MSKASIGTAVIGGFLVLMGLTGVASYRQLASRDARVDDAWQQLLAAYDERIESASTNVSTDPGLARSVARAYEALQRAEGISAPDESDVAVFVEGQAALEHWLSEGGAARPLDASVESVAAARHAFNEATLGYNRTRRRFPTILIALAAGFPDRPYLDLPKQPD